MLGILLLMQLSAAWTTASLPHIITAVKSRLRQVAWRRLAPFGLSPQQYQLLMAIAEEDGRCHGDLAGFAMVLAGRAEAWLEAGVKVWDLAPMKVLAEEAGGRFTDLEGRPTIHSGACVVSNGHVHAHVLAALAPSEGRPA